MAWRRTPQLALACLSRTRDIWIAAGRFQPNLAFRPSDLKILSLAVACCWINAARPSPGVN